MSTQIEPDSLHQDPRWQLVQRVTSSQTLRTSQRLRELLLFITRRVLLDPDSGIREQEIGAGVFGRPAEYDTSADTIVRVHTHQLRKRLQKYFDTEGRQEPVVIEIPRGSYVPVFLSRPAGEVTVPPARSPTVNRRLVAWAAAGAVVLLVLGCCLGWYLRSGWQPGAGGVADAFWNQMFDNGKSIDLVLGDASFSFIQGPPILRRDVPKWVYEGRSFDRVFQELQDPAVREVARGLMGCFYVPFADAAAAHRLGVMAATHRTAMDTVFARNFSTGHLDSHNIILAGNRRSNPWMAYFEDRLDFQYGYDIEKDFGYFRNVRPRQGEPQIYRVVWNARGLSRVAYLPNLTRTGTVLILAGTDVVSSEAGARVITSNEWVARIREHLRLRPRAPLPYFEALLTTDLLMGSAPRFELLTVRVHDR